MKKGAILLNTSRGSVVDEAALLEALDADAVRAGLDVFADEPSSGKGAWDSPLARHPNVVATHHIGASTAQAQRAIAAGVTEIVEAFMNGEARHCVNLDPDRLGSVTLTVRHLDRVGVLAHVLEELRSAGLNVEHMVNRVFRGGEAAVATIDVADPASDELLTALRAIPHVLGVSVVTLGESAATAVSSVRLFPARVVRQEWARRTVTAMSDSLDESGVELLGVELDPATYDESPVALYVYRQSRGDASYTGVVGDIAVQAIADGRVRGHEAVHPQRVEALLWHRETTQAPPALVTLLHRAGPVFTRTIEEVQRTPPLLDFGGPRGLQQTVWRLSEGPAVNALVSELAAADFYIADGHHRTAAALEEWRLAGKPADAGLLGVIHPMDGLRAVGVPPPAVRPGRPRRTSSACCRRTSRSVRSAAPRLRRPGRSGCTSGAAGSSSATRAPPGRCLRPRRHDPPDPGPRPPGRRR